MLRFVALICTIIMTGVAIAARHIADGDVPVLTPIFAAVLPGQIHSRAINATVAGVLQLACYTITHFYLKRLYNLATAETEAAPRPGLAGLAARRDRANRQSQAASPVRWRLRRPREDRFWATMQRLFSTPTGGWLAPFAIPLGIIIFIGSPLAFTGHAPAWLWGLSLLFSRTLASVRRKPDIPDPLLEPERVASVP